MTLTIELSPELGRRLIEESQRLGRPPEAVAADALSEHLCGADRRRETVEMLESWIDEADPDVAAGDPDEFLQALDANRRHDARKLFPADHKGITW